MRSVTILTTVASRLQILSKKVCKAHYSRFQRLLDVAMRRGPSRGSLIADFAAHMNVAASLEDLIGANRAALLAGSCGGWGCGAGGADFGAGELLTQFKCSTIPPWHDVMKAHLDTRGGLKSSQRGSECAALLSPPARHGLPDAPVA